MSWFIGITAFALALLCGWYFGQFDLWLYKRVISLTSIKHIYNLKKIVPATVLAVLILVSTVAEYGVSCSRMHVPFSEATISQKEQVFGYVEEIIYTGDSFTASGWAIDMDEKIVPTRIIAVCNGKIIDGDFIRWERKDTADLFDCPDTNCGWVFNSIPKQDPAMKDDIKFYVLDGTGKWVELGKTLT
jgi:hypothetical protein